MNEYMHEEGFVVGTCWKNRFNHPVKIITVFDNGGALVRLDYYPVNEKCEYVVDRNGKVHNDRLSGGDLICHWQTK